MTRKAHVVSILREYFQEKGKILSYEEYIEATDAPFRVHIIKRTIGRWPRLVRLVGPITPKVVVPAKAPVPKPQTVQKTEKK